MFKALRGFLNKSRRFNEWLNKPSSSRNSTWLKSCIQVGNVEGLVRLDQAWLPYKALRILELINKDAKVFEWGSGASTVWLAKRFASIISIEHDPFWHHSVKRIVEDYKFQNIGLKLIMARESRSPRIASSREGYRNLDFFEYVMSIDDHDKFDLIVIDGRARVACLERALNHLNEGGIVLLDNVQRRRYWKAIRALKGRYQTHAVFGLTSSSLVPTICLFVYSPKDSPIFRE